MNTFTTYNTKPQFLIFWDNVLGQFIQQVNQHPESALTFWHKLGVDDVEAGLEWLDHMETAVSSAVSQKTKRI